MAYSLAILWHERVRFLPAVLSVAFSALLTVMQIGLLLGLFWSVSMPIDRSRADIWVGYPGVQSADQCLPIPEVWRLRLEQQPEVERVEPYLRGMVYWGVPGQGIELCPVIGTRMDPEAFGPVQDLTPELRHRLAEDGAIVVDEEEMGRLGIKGVGDSAEVAGCRVQVVGLVRGLKGTAGVYLFCSIPTARRLLRLPADETTYLLARCRDRADAAVVVERLRDDPTMTACTSEEFAQRTRMHWMTRTKAGVAMGWSALLGLLIGAAVTSQTLYAATAASARQYAILEALGIPSWRMRTLVLVQSFWVGLLGIGLAVPATWCLAQLVEALGARFQLPIWVLSLAAALTMAMALLSGLVALRSLRLAEPTALLR